MEIRNDNNDNSPTWSATALCWKHRRLYLVVSVVCILLAIIVSVSIPKTYAASVKVADEPKEIDYIVGLSSYSAWIKQIMSDYKVNELMSESEVYRKFLNSETFMESLSTIYIPDYDTDYYHYLVKYHKRAWWVSLCKNISSILGAYDEKEEVLSIIKNNVRSNFSQKYNTISIRVVDNNAEVAALLADSVKSRLQTEIIDNRRKYSQANLINADKKKNQLEKEYYNAQDKYITYRDSHFDGSQPNVKITLDALNKERNKAFDDYSDAYEQYIRAEILHHRNITSFSVLKNATVPVNPFEPKFVVYFLLFLFLGLVFTTWWILFERLIKNRKIR
ncbi:MAG: hypothetical protein LUC88_06300 [Prevotella sp.]|nr:hypothetical protein [Prevotella sp.]